MEALLDAIFKRFIIHGRLSVRYPSGRFVTYGDTESGPAAGVEFRSERAIRRMIFDPALAVGEIYMDGDLVPLGGTIYDTLTVLMENQNRGGSHPGLSLLGKVRVAARPLAQWNPIGRARRNVAHHYDLGDKLYSLFLDADWQYSCAYFRTGRETLEEAQAAKKRHIAAKLLLDRPNLRVLDIGCGWGGMALTLARDYGARVFGVTLSTEQLTRARSRAAAAGLEHRVQFELLDYRDGAVPGPFDRIVSVGMFEHVGVNHYPAFFQRMRSLLAPDGVALLHAIGRSDGPGYTNPWIARYIFPGGYTPALSEVFAASEQSGLVATDVEILRMHYAETLRHWRRRFAAARAKAEALYDERLCRMFEMYLAGSEIGFRHSGLMVWQLQLAQSLSAAPFTRDYMAAAEGLSVASREDAD